MCEATVYLDDELVLEDVMSVEVVPDGVRLTSMAEPSLFIAGTVREIDLTNHRVVLAPARPSR